MKQPEHSAKAPALARYCALVAALALPAVLAACGKFRQAQECAQFSEVVRTWLNHADASADQLPTDRAKIAAESRKLAARYEDLLKKLDALHVASPELKARTTKYQALSTRAANVLREVADAVEREEDQGARQKRVEFVQAAEDERLLVREINELCR